MTVKELIEELQCYEGDKKVWICVGDMFTTVTEADLEGTIGDNVVVIR